MCTPQDFAAYKAAKDAIADAQQAQNMANAQQAQPYEDTLIQQLKTGKSVTLPTVYSGSQTPKGKESGAYLSLGPMHSADKADMISELTDINTGVHENTPQVAVRKALKLQTIDDHI